MCTGVKWWLLGQTWGKARDHSPSSATKCNRGLKLSDLPVPWETGQVYTGISEPAKNGVDLQIFTECPLRPKRICWGFRVGKHPCEFAGSTDHSRGQPLSLPKSKPVTFAFTLCILGPLHPWSSQISLNSPWCFFRGTSCASSLN